MQPPSMKNRYRRLFRRRKKQIEALGASAEEQLERNFLGRFGRLQKVGRFVAGWVLLVLLLVGCVTVQTMALGGYYKSLQPAAGGIYSEGMVDSYTNANPLYATGLANGSVSKLLFASLFKYDEQNQLVGDLAERMQADPAGTKYTVTLRPNLTWHDGRSLTANDVVFTYRSIQNPDIQSPLNVSWQDVQIAAPDARTVVFDLPNPLSSFPHSLTNGVIPEHLLKDVPAETMRSVRFNTVNPVGSGPFMMKAVEVSGNDPASRREEIALVPFENYHSGAPKISSFIVRTYRDEATMLTAFSDRTINAMVGVQRLPQEIASQDGVQTQTMPLTAANMVFFKTTAPGLSETAVRQALVAAADIDSLTKDLPKPVLPVRSPLLQSSAGYKPQYAQSYQGPEKAAAILESAGWKLQSNGLRAKAGKALSFKLYAQRGQDYEAMTSGLTKQWRQIGVDTQVVLQSQTDLPTTVADHDYDALLYGISLGVDPDEYVYWHSRQADVRSPSRLNLSEYKSAVADAALEAGRTRTDASLRAVKLQPFLQAWQTDAPALGLYQPHFGYVTRGPVYGFKERTLTQGTDRFNTVHDWMIRREPQPIK